MNVIKMVLLQMVREERTPAKTVCQPAPFSALPAGTWRDEPDGLADADYDPDAGYRKQELVFIGQNMDRQVIEAALESALLNDRELADGPDSWMNYDDVFAQFSGEDEAEEGAEDDEEGLRRQTLAQNDTLK